MVLSVKMFQNVTSNFNISEFVGCYKDQWSRTLNGKKTKSSKMSVDKCRKTCTDLKFKYYGVEVSSILTVILSTSYEITCILEMCTFM